MLPVCRTPDDVYAIPPFEVTCKDVEGFLDELGEFHALFRDCFVRREPREHFFRSMVGQFSSLERKSIEPIAVQTEASSIRAMQRSLSDTQWNDARMLQTYHQQVAKEMGAPDGVLIVDESGFVKKGQDSVGVARPYGGTLGKVDHGQGGGCAFKGEVFCKPLIIYRFLCLPQLRSSPVSHAAFGMALTGTGTSSSSGGTTGQGSGTKRPCGMGS